MGPMLLLATVLYNVKFVTTAAMGAVYKYNPEVRARRRAGRWRGRGAAGRAGCCRARALRMAWGEGGEGSLTMLMVKAVVLFYSAKLLNMGVLVVFMHD